MKQILNQIYTKTKGSDSVLLLDKYPVHITELIKSDAKSKNIILLFVYKYLPTNLNCHIFVDVLDNIWT